MGAGFGVSRSARALATALVVVLLAALADAAGAGVPQPDPAKGKGEACVAETDFMRRNHPSLLNHQRDDTVRRGIRGDKFSLKGCIACHAVLGPDAKPVTIKNPQHFCRECHDYVAVQIDCFECHNSLPDDDRRAAINFKMPGAANNPRRARSLELGALDPENLQKCRLEQSG